MLTDGKFTLSHTILKYKTGDIFTLRPFGDVHRDSPTFSKDTWNKFLETSKKLKNPLFYGVGDYFDSYSTSERIIIGNPGIHESTRKNWETMAREKVEDFASEIGFMKGNLIGLMGGNHYISFADGTTSDQYLAHLLGTRYLGVSCLARMSFQSRTNHGGGCCIDIFSHHGKGAGTTTTGRMNAVEKMTQICDADIYLMGHNHARGVLPLGERLGADINAQGMYLKARKMFIGRTGGFLRGYVENESSYITDSCMVPTSLGWIDFTLEPIRTREQGKDRITIKIGAIQ
jgi:hypothetical protein